MKRFMVCDTCGERIIITFNWIGVFKCTHCGSKNDIDRNKNAKRPRVRWIITFTMVTGIILVGVASICYSAYVSPIPLDIIFVTWIPVFIMGPPFMNFLKALFCYEKVSENSEVQQ